MSSVWRYPRNVLAFGAASFSQPSPSETSIAFQGGERGDARHVAGGVVVHPRGERQRRRRAEGRGDQAERAVADERRRAIGGVGGRKDECRVLEAVRLTSWRSVTRYRTQERPCKEQRYEEKRG